MGDTRNKATVENRIRFDSKNVTMYTIWAQIHLSQTNLTNSKEN